MNDESLTLNFTAAEALAKDSWDEVCANWACAELHDAFVQLCNELDLLDWAAKRYTESRSERPGDATTRRMLSRILALGLLRFDRPERKQKRRTRGSKIGLVALIVLAILLPFVIYFAFARRTL